MAKQHGRSTEDVPRESKLDSGALKRGFAILEILVEATHPLTSRDIAEQLQLSDSTVYRLLQTMCEAGYVIRDDARRYHAASKALLPLTIYHPLIVFRRDAFEILRAAREESGLTASVVVFVGNERLVLDVAGIVGSLTPFYTTRLENAIHVSAAGKLLLLSKSPADRKAILGPGPYKALTPETITDPAVFEEHLQQVAAAGFATNINENFIGLSAVAAPLITGPNQIVGCLIVAGASDRVAGDRAIELGQSLRNGAKLLSAGSAALRSVRAMFARMR